MKLFRILLGALLTTSLLTACQHDAPDPGGAPTEEYMRAFIKEFGVPAKGHTFSMARSAGLQIKSSRPMRVMVTAVVDGVEYLFGDVTVREGLTPIPVTIPNQVETVNLTIGAWKYAVAADGIADLDNLPDPLPSADSRTINVNGKWTYNASGNKWNGSSIIDDKNGYPILAFKTSDFLHGFLQRHPQGVDKPEWEWQKPEEWYDRYQATDWIPWCDTSFGLYPESSSTDYLVFPIYYSNRKSNTTGFTAYLTPREEPTKEGVSLGKPMNYLRKVTNVSDVKDITSWTMSNYSYANNYDASQDLIIMSQGDRVHFTGDVGYDVSMEIQYTKNGVTYKSNSCPYRNALAWGDNYFPADLDHLSFAMGSTARWPVPGKFLVYEDGTAMEIDGEYAFLIGFNTAPEKPNDISTKRDYSDVIYLVIPTHQMLISYKYSNPKTYPTYKWTIFAEDLGGTFDWDFNDAVFEFTDVVESLVSVNEFIDEYQVNYGGLTDATLVRNISVTPLAAGGTMPLYITYTGRLSPSPSLPTKGNQDYYGLNGSLKTYLNMSQEGTWVLGTEIHKWLGASTHTRQLNTGEKVELAPGQTVKFAIPHDETLINRHYGNWQKSADNEPLAGFAVLVDKENKLNIEFNRPNGFQALPEYTLGKDTYMIGKPCEDNDNVAPQMILIKGGSHEWPREYINIKEPYPYFERWINENYGGPWVMGPNHDKVTCRGH